MNDSTRQLDPFEAALLDELRSHVAARTPRRRPVRRWALGAAAAATAGAAVLVTGLGGLGATPAYAVATTAGGDVVVTVHRLEDASGLEADLRQAGIDAEVSFVRDSSQGALFEVWPHDPSLPLAGGCVRTDERPTLRRDGGDWVLRIPSDSPLQDRPVRVHTQADGSLVMAYPTNSHGGSCAVSDVGTRER